MHGLWKATDLNLNPNLHCVFMSPGVRLPCPRMETQRYWEDSLSVQSPPLTHATVETGGE